MAISQWLLVVSKNTNEQQTILNMGSGVPQNDSNISNLLSLFK